LPIAIAGFAVFKNFNTPFFALAVFFPVSSCSDPFSPQTVFFSVVSVPKFACVPILKFFSFFLSAVFFLSL